VFVDRFPRFCRCCCKIAECFQNRSSGFGASLCVPSSSFSVSPVGGVVVFHGLVPPVLLIFVFGVVFNFCCKS
jgi:hypothetical protein